MEEQKKSRYTEAQKRSAEKYLARLSDIKLRMPPEEKKRIQAAAAAAGESVNQYMITATLQRIERETI